VVEERVDAGAGVSPTLGDEFLLSTSVVDVAVRVGPGLPETGSPYTFPIRAAGGQLLAEAAVPPGRLAAARDRWDARTRAAALIVFALTVLACGVPLLDVHRRARAPRTLLGTTVGLTFIAGLARALVWVGAAPFSGTPLSTPLALVPNALALGALVWLALDLLERWRTAPARERVKEETASTYAHVMLAYGAGGAAAATVLWAYERALQTIAARSTFDLIHFSLYPFEPARLSVAFALVLLHAAVVWGAATLLRAATIAARVPRSRSMHVARLAAVGAGVGLVIAIGSRLVDGVPVGPLLAGVAGAGAIAVALGRPRGPWRRASQAARLGLLVLALVVPAVAMYPSVHAFATRSREALVAGTYAPQVARQREDLKSQRLPHALDAIDANPSLAELVTSSSEDAAPTTDRAFLVWSRTELATYRTTSAVELYGPNGRLVSRFALILPEYGTTNDRLGGCDEWDLYEEASPFGSILRPVLRASRAICDGGRPVGAIVVRAMLDYRSLPFSSSESPYLEALRPDQRTASEARFEGDVSFAVYGWSRAPIYAPETSVWPLPDAVFNRMVASREPLWTEVRRNGEVFRVYFFNDSFGVYALGYPVISRTGHLINLGELIFLTFGVFLLFVLAATIFNAVTRRSHQSGRALLREVRSSFYRKLFMAFVASAVIPVIVLAVATRTYLVNQLRATVEESATRTVTIAQRLVEDYAQQLSATAGSPRVDDQFMVLVRWAIDQDVNLFEQAHLQATSERDLFASRLLPARTPSHAYRSIVLDRLPTSVAVEDVGGVPYLLAAAPVRTGGRQGIVTVPQPLRSEEIERQRDELDRGVLSLSVLFVLLGAALGYWMAERIADPVNRLTRATRRIARGDLDARVAATSSDELRRLVEDFNRMADDLKRQRADLERTQRLEAWADMARQVAHDIKNPLTPIQLSAEHARRVNLDRGRPLSPALDECVNAILSQVRLLRQIAAEFSSFASSPTARIEPVPLPELVDEVVEPYRIGLAGRVAIEVHSEAGLPSVLADRTLLGRALTNIIENALHAMPGGGSLHIDCRQAGGVILEVADTGVGMDQDALRKIFQPYFSTKASGTGLGLTIAKRNVELSGGSIAVTSTRGAGTSVTLSLRPAVDHARGAPS
jgi:signal transduction histidine kinase